MKIFVKFSNWYSDNVEKSILITFIILCTQIPHWMWGGDALVQSGWIFGFHPITDFFLFGIDFLEAPLLVKTFGDYIILRRKKNKK